MPKADPLYEVVTDTWGWQETYKKGDRVRRSELKPGFDADFALEQGAIREVGPDEPAPAAEQAAPETPES